MTATPLFKKLNFKNHEQILVLDSPTEFEPELHTIKNFTVLETDIETIGEIEFVLSFVIVLDAIIVVYSYIDEKLIFYGLVLFFFPKKSFKNYTL